MGQKNSRVTFESYHEGTVTVPIKDVQAIFLSPPNKLNAAHDLTCDSRDTEIVLNTQNNSYRIKSYKGDIVADNKLKIVYYTLREDCGFGKKGF